MLVIFKSKAGADIIMFEENAREILDLFGKDIEKGITTLEKEIKRRKQIEAEEKAERERMEREEQERKEKEAEEDKDKDPFDDRKKEPRKPEPPVSFSARSYPFLQLLKAANKKKKDIYWGV